MQEGDEVGRRLGDPNHLNLKVSLDKSRTCGVGVKYDFPQNAKACQEKLERTKKDGSVVYFTSESSFDTIHGSATWYSAQRCRPGDTFVSEKIRSVNKLSKACAATLSQKTGIDFEAVETNPGFILADYKVLPKLSGSVFGAFSALLQKFQFQK